MRSGRATPSTGPRCARKKVDSATAHVASLREREDRRSFLTYVRGIQGRPITTGDLIHNRNGDVVRTIFGGRFDSTASGRKNLVDALREFYVTTYRFGFEGAEIDGASRDYV